MGWFFTVETVAYSIIRVLSSMSFRSSIQGLLKIVFCKTSLQSICSHLIINLYYKQIWCCSIPVVNQEWFNQSISKYKKLKLVKVFISKLIFSWYVRTSTWEKPVFERTGSYFLKKSNTNPFLDGELIE